MIKHNVFNTALVRLILIIINGNGMQQPTIKTHGCLA